MSKRRTSKNKNPFEKKHQRHITSFTKSTISSEAKSSKPITKKPTNSSVSNNASSKINTSGAKKMPITSDKKLPKEPLSAEKHNIQEKVDKKSSQDTRESKSENLEIMNLCNKETESSQNTKPLVQNGSNPISDHLDQSTNDEIDSSYHRANDTVNGTHNTNNNVLDNSGHSAAAIISNNEADEAQSGSKDKKTPTSFRQKINYVLKKVLFKKHVERK